jgi:hypothetical protein
MSKRFTEEEQDRIRRVLPGDWYRMHPQAQAVYWQRAAAELGITGQN